LARMYPQEPGHMPDSQGGKNTNFGLSCFWPMHQRCCRNHKGNKVIKPIFKRSREFIMPADSGEIISQSPEPQTVSGAWLNTYRVCSLSYPLLPPLLLVCGCNCGKLCKASRWLQCCRASRKLLVDSGWGNQGEYHAQKIPGK
jgi:hypothetical protein